MTIRIHCGSCGAESYYDSSTEIHCATCWRKAMLHVLTLATLCDMVLGEEAEDRSDDTLVRAVGELLRKPGAI